MYQVNSYRSRLRILLILYFFSEDIEFDSELRPELVKVFKSEVKIQKIDFLIRYPDYFASELLFLLETSNPQAVKIEIKEIVRDIFRSKEPELRKEEMLRFFFGAYEDIDDIISFLVSRDFIKYESKRSIDGRVFDKVYYLTDFGINKIENEILTSLNNANWYKERCRLIKRFFGDLSGSELKFRQYQHEEYKNTPLNQYINGVEEEVKNKFLKIFGEELEI
ncbi:hypothetical protein [Sporosarcina newyorkensis]|uniref:hypothetical protein n=1 Tax=Sporosarcina newyorkensis TaxID=759851 RepID=UPI003CFE3E1B